MCTLALLILFRFMLLWDSRKNVANMSSRLSISQMMFLLLLWFSKRLPFFKYLITFLLHFKLLFDLDCLIKIWSFLWTCLLSVESLWILIWCLTRYWFRRVDNFLLFYWFSNNRWNLTSCRSSLSWFIRYCAMPAMNFRGSTICFWMYMMMMQALKIVSWTTRTLMGHQYIFMTCSYIFLVMKWT